MQIYFIHQCPTLGALRSTNHGKYIWPLCLVWLLPLTPLPQGVDEDNFMSGTGIHCVDTAV